MSDIIIRDFTHMGEVFNGSMAAIGFVDTYRLQDLTPINAVRSIDGNSYLVRGAPAFSLNLQLSLYRMPTFEEPTPPNRSINIIPFRLGDPRPPENEPYYTEDEDGGESLSIILPKGRKIRV